MSERLPEEIPPILTAFSRATVDLFNLDNRRIHDLARDIAQETGMRVRPFDLWRYYSISMHGIACDPTAHGRKVPNFPRVFELTASMLERELHRVPQACEVYIRIYETSLSRFLDREAREMSKGMP